MRGGGRVVWGAGGGGAKNREQRCSKAMAVQGFKKLDSMGEMVGAANFGRREGRAGA